MSLSEEKKRVTAPAARTKRTIALISTGGTIEKTYDALSGLLVNEVSVLDVMLASLELSGVELVRVALMNKDSLEMSEDERSAIVEVSHQYARTLDGVVIVHGTDTLAETGEAIFASGNPASPIVLTGAMRPYVMRNTDAMQNLAEALLAVQLAQPGVYCAMHNQLLPFPGVKKDRSAGSFYRTRH